MLELPQIYFTNTLDNGMYLGVVARHALSHTLMRTLSNCVENAFWKLGLHWRKRPKVCSLEGHSSG